MADTVPEMAPLGGMRSLRVLARLLDYPCEALQAAADEMIEVLDAERRLSASHRTALVDWCRRLMNADLMDLQAEYVALFDRGRWYSRRCRKRAHPRDRTRSGWR